VKPTPDTEENTMDIKKMVPWNKNRAVVERDPFAMFRREMNSLFDDFFADRGEALESFTPKVDMKENGKDVVVTAELPGMDEKDVEITLSHDALTISGEKKEEKEEKSEERYRLERSYGAFRRTLALPCEVDPDKATAAYKKGVLTVTLPKTAAAATTKRIPIKAA
jgi:HSP20 family protein